MKLRLLLSALLLPAAALAEIQFNGVVVDSNGKTKVSLINTVTGDFHWVSINGKFGNFTVTQYRPGKPANPSRPGDTGTKDTVVLTSGGNSRSQTIIPLNDAFILNTPVSNTPSASGAQASAIASLNDRLAQEMAKPNPDPQIIQSLQQTIQRQSQIQQQLTLSNAGSTLGVTNFGVDVTAQPTTRTITVGGPNGQQQTITVQPGQNLQDAVTAARASMGQAAPGQPAQ
jgi:hypothetical protein